jgi:hypothetical protein
VINIQAEQLHAQRAALGVSRAPLQSNAAIWMHKYWLKLTSRFSYGQRKNLPFANFQVPCEFISGSYLSLFSMETIKVLKTLMLCKSRNNLQRGKRIKVMLRIQILEHFSISELQGARANHELQTPGYTSLRAMNISAAENPHTCIEIKQMGHKRISLFLNLILKIQYSILKFCTVYL